MWITYQFSNVVVGKNELCQAGQSLFKVFTNPTKEEQKKTKVKIRPEVSNGEKTHRNTVTQRGSL